MDIKALCAATLEALGQSPSQMPLSCPVAPQIGRPKFIKLQASAPSPFAHIETRRGTWSDSPRHRAVAVDVQIGHRAFAHAEKHIAMTPNCRLHAPALSPTPTRAEHLAGLHIVRLRALVRRRAPKKLRTSPGCRPCRASRPRQAEACGRTPRCGAGLQISRPRRQSARKMYRKRPLGLPA